MFKLLSIDDMICQSILSVNNPEIRKRLTNSILVVGGGGKFKGIIDYLEDRLFEKLTSVDEHIERVEIINFPNVDMKTITWIGGTIIPKLESSKDMWITKERWCCELDLDNNKEDFNRNKDPLNDLALINFDNDNNNHNKNENRDNNNDNNLNLNENEYFNSKNKTFSNSEINGLNNHIKSISNNYNNEDGLSGFKNESINKDKEKDKEKNKKRERPLDGGIKMIREKCPFKW
jgi:hypothetical protein